jgi:predicted HTH transcriptional regulator
MAFVERNMKTESRIESVYRQDIPEYPEVAVREVLTNAVMHRDYNSPQKIMLWMFDDRLEVENPGGLLGGLTIEALLARPRSYPRNKLLMRLAKDMGLVEEGAIGILSIFAEMRENGSPEPIFTADATFFMVTLPSRWWEEEEE